MSSDWLKSLPLGAIILAPYQGYIEELKVIRAHNPKRQLLSVLIKRPHLKQCLPMTAFGDNFVQYQFCSRVGNTHHDFRKWEVKYPD